MASTTPTSSLNGTSTSTRTTTPFPIITPPPKPPGYGLIGPLATQWIAPSDCDLLSLCFTTYTDLNPPFTFSSYFQYYPFATGGPSCFPPEWYPPPTWSDHQGGYLGYYSPGICPSSWVNQLTQVNSGETTLYCCPQELPTISIDPTSNAHCFGTVTNGGQQRVAIFVAIQSSFVSFDTRTLSSLFSTSTYIAGYGIQVRFKDGDFLAATESPSVAPSTADTSSVGLSTAAKIGIGIGASVFALVVCAMIYFFFRQRRRSRTSAAMTDRRFEFNEKPEQPGVVKDSSSE
jgi:hypothetical protein